MKNLKKILALLMFVCFFSGCVEGEVAPSTQLTEMEGKLNDVFLIENIDRQEIIKIVNEKMQIYDDFEYFCLFGGDCPKLNNMPIFYDSEEETQIWEEIEARYTITEMLNIVEENYTGNLYEYYKQFVENNFFESDNHLYKKSSEGRGYFKLIYDFDMLIIDEASDDIISVEFEVQKHDSDPKFKMSLTLKRIEGKWKISKVLLT